MPCWLGSLGALHAVTCVAGSREGMKSRAAEQAAIHNSEMHSRSKTAAADTNLRLTSPRSCCPAALALSQVFGSMLFIIMYYWRRITWRLRNRKGKQRIARAARDALALKKKNSDTFDIHATASAGTSITDRVSVSELGMGRVGRCTCRGHGGTTRAHVRCGSAAPFRP